MFAEIPPGVLHHQVCIGCCSRRCGADWQGSGCTTFLLTALGFLNADRSWPSHRLADWQFVHALQEQQLAQMELQSSAKQKFIANLRAKLENAELETEQLKYKLQQK